MRRPLKTNSPAGPNSRSKIMVVEDERGIRECLKSILEDEGFTVTCAGSAEEGLDFYYKAKPDLIITDVWLPGMDGLELAKRIREQDPVTPIIVISGHLARTITIDAANVGVDLCLAKPCTIEQVVSCVKEFSGMSSVELENRRLKYLAHSLKEENRRLNEALQEQTTKKTLDVNNHREQAFYESTIHDINNELALMGDAVRSLKQTSANAPETKEDYQLIVRGLHHISQLIRSISDYVHTTKHHLEPIGIPDLVARVEAVVRPRITSNIQFELIADFNALNGKVLVDPEQVAGAVKELTNNAMYVLRSNAGTIRVEFNIKGDNLTIAVSNNGPAIDEDIRDNIFKRHVRSSKERGGMGLFLLSKVLKMLGGEISLKGSDEWTTFVIQLPLYMPKKEA